MQFNRLIKSTTRLFQSRTFGHYTTIVPKGRKHVIGYLPRRFEHSGSSESVNTSVNANQPGSTQVVFPFISRASQEPDETLRLIFDDPDFWNHFTSRSQTLAALEYGTSLVTRKLTGLFRNPELATPQGFH